MPIRSSQGDEARKHWASARPGVGARPPREVLGADVEGCWALLASRSSLASANGFPAVEQPDSIFQ